MSQARKISDFADAVTSLRIIDNDENKAPFNITGQIPNDLTKQTIEKTYNILGITPEQFIEGYGSATFDFSQLQAEFSTICCDYLEVLDGKKSSYAVDFCSKIIYKIAPDFRKGKRNENKTYRFKFIYAPGGVLIKTTTCLVSAYRGVEYKKNYVANETICLTIGLASMLAVVTLNQIVPIAIDKDIFLLTPLAGACFNKDDIEELATKLEVTSEELVKDLNSGCQSGGQHLDNGYLHIALCYAIVATRGLKDEKMREVIISETIKQYYQAKKPLDDGKFTVCAGYASGGIPGFLSVKALIAQYETVQTLAAKQVAKALAQTMLQSTVAALNIP